MNDFQTMRRCIELARLGEYYVAPNPMVGAVLVADDGRILGEGYHRQYGGPHAEVWCFRDAEARGVTPEQIHQATLYVSLEPCSHYGKTPPCALLIAEKHPRRLVCGMQDPNPKVAGRGLQICREAGIEVICGVLEDECRALNKRFLMLQEHHRPYIILKWAETADGFLDNRPQSASQSPQSAPLVISTPLTKRLVHKMRAENMAILVGSGTALMDNPKLGTTRWPGRNPVRVLLDHRGRVPATSHLLQDANEPSDYPGLPRTLIFGSQSPQSPSQSPQSAQPLPTLYNLSPITYNLSEELTSHLASLGIHSVLVEGGRAVLESFIQAGLYDEVHIEVNPHLFAHVGTPAPVFPDRDALICTPIDGNLCYHS